MASLRTLSITVFAVALFIAELRADDSKPYDEPLILPADAASMDDASPQPARTGYELVQPVLGRGYVPYSYPVFDSCPCDNAGCFHPGRYYCGGKQYRKGWFRKWVKAHLGHGSMLDDQPCHCVFPTVGRPYLQSVPAADPSPNHALPPAPDASSSPQK